MPRKRFLVLILVFLWLLMCGVVIKFKVRRRSTTPLKSGKGKEVLPILMIACNRSFVDRSLRSLTYFRRNSTAFPIIVYNDCGSNEIIQTVKDIADWDPTITVVQNPNPKHRQLKFALNHVIGTLQNGAVIVLDDNLDISPDFFEYFLATYRLLEKDPSIWCVSAWNDNCKKGLVDMTEPQLLHRTEFFPGKGWMIRSEIWEEIEPHLTATFDAELLRIPDIIRGRVCIRPEISRTYNFRAFKASNVEIEDYHLRHKQRTLNTEFVPFTRYNLSYLLKENEHLFVSFVYSCPETTAAEVKSGTLNSSLKCVRIPYSTAEMFRKTAKTFGLMYDFRHGVTRTALHGIVQCFVNGRRVFLAPVNNTLIPSSGSPYSGKS